MSPVLIPEGYTKRFLDGEIDPQEQFDRIQAAFQRCQQDHPFTVCEGTGHAGVGSIVGCSNADVARILGVDVVMIATGGLGSAFDELALNVNLFHVSVGAPAAPTGGVASHDATRE